MHCTLYFKQAQLSQGDCTMLRVTEYSKWHSWEERKSLLVFWCNYVCIAYGHTVSEIFSVKEWCDLENCVRYCSRSLKMMPFNTPCTTFYRSAVVRRALSCITSETKWDICQKLLFFSYPLASGYQTVKKFYDTFSHFGRIPDVTDGRTNILWQHSSRYVW